MKATRNQQTGAFIRDFDNWEDWLNTATRGKCHHQGSRTSRDVQESRTQWTGTASFEQAEKLARNGWPEGLDRVKSMADTIKAILCSKVIRPEPRFADSGDEVDVGRFIGNDPEHWIEFPMAEAKATGGRIVTLGFNLFLSSGVNRELFQVRGAAVLALMDALEMAGYRCELHLCMGASGRDGGSYQMQVPAKEANQPAELDRLAFVFSHESMFRRLQLSVGECDEDQSCRDAFGIGKYYWLPDTFHQAVTMDFFFERLGLDDSNAKWSTVESATAEVLRLLKASNLVELNEPA